MNNMRQTHTTQANKAKCLAYRNGKRCGRVATHIVRYNGARGAVGEQPRCDECASHDDVISSIDSQNGFIVSTDPFAYVGGRSYVAID